MIKWIGNHIVELIARFKSDVYLESISLTEDEIEMLTVNAVGKVSKGPINIVNSFPIKGYGTSDGTNYEMPEILSDANAPFEHNTSTGSDGLTAQEPRVFLKSGGHVMPRSGVLINWRGWASMAGTSGTATIGLFKATLTRNSITTVTPVLLKATTFTPLGNTYLEDLEEISFDVTFTRGDIIYTAVHADVIKAWWLNSTLEVQWT